MIQTIKNNGKNFAVKIDNIVSNASPIAVNATQFRAQSTTKPARPTVLLKGIWKAATMQVKTSDYKVPVV